MSGAHAHMSYKYSYQSDQTIGVWLQLSPKILHEPLDTAQYINDVTGVRKLFLSYSTGCLLLTLMEPDILGMRQGASCDGVIAPARKHSVEYCCRVMCTFAVAIIFDFVSPLWPHTTRYRGCRTKE